MLNLMILAILFIQVESHSWMSCPPSFNPSTGRGGIQGPMCEGTNPDSAPVTEVYAGDRLKVGWVSNNHAGGYARIALVSYGQQNEQTLKQNVLKFACYGSDQSSGPKSDASQTGDCKHPCNARPGCKFQSSIKDVERYDTTVGIPTNLAEGYYVLQTSLLVGNGVTPYNSCAKLLIKGGNPSFQCQSNQPAPEYQCLKSNSGAPLSVLQSGTRGGNFCYNLDGTMGSVDGFIREVPVNVQCDPRVACSLSTSATCVNVPGMTSILTPGTDPRQGGCDALNALPNPL